MTGLIEAFDLAGLGIVDGDRHAIEIAIKQIDMDAVDQQPAAAVDPGPPAAERRDVGLGVSIVEAGHDPAQDRDVDRLATAIVEPDVVVGVGRRRAASARAAERHGLDAGHRRQRFDHAARLG
jgi:hypothetical protein